MLFAGTGMDSGVTVVLGTAAVADPLHSPCRRMANGCPFPPFRRKPDIGFFTVLGMASDDVIRQLVFDTTTLEEVSRETVLWKIQY